MNRRLALAVLCLSPLSVPARAADPDLPSAESILDHFVEVTGGKTAYEARKTEITTGRLEFAAAGVRGAIVQYAAAPDRYYSSLDIEGIGKVEMGVTEVWLGRRAPSWARE